ncbi:MAG: hypothetical protein GY835_23225 [bacterium]|nr:hypothetical protein [bacterium]
MLNDYEAAPLEDDDLGTPFAVARRVEPKSWWERMPIVGKKSFILEVQQEGSEAPEPYEVLDRSGLLRFCYELRDPAGHVRCTMTARLFDLGYVLRIFPVDVRNRYRFRAGASEVAILDAAGGRVGSVWRLWPLLILPERGVVKYCFELECERSQDVNLPLFIFVAVMLRSRLPA